MRVLVTGSSGQLAEAIRRCWTGHELLMPPESDLDLSRPEAVHRIVPELRPEVVINAGAFTQVDRCEAEPGLAMRVNGDAVGWLAEACSGIGALLVQISTDYVFDGRYVRPYREEDAPAPRTVYGQSKLRGEQAAARAPQHLVVRTAWLYDAWGANFYGTMLKAAADGKALRVVDDQRGTPTTCRALARQLQVAVEAGWRGIVHATCEGETTWFGFAAEIFRQWDRTVDLSPCRTEEFPRPAPRPAYSVLSGEKRRKLGGDVMPEWRAALAEVVAEARGGHSGGCDG